jgi:hypothetical protein
LWEGQPLGKEFHMAANVSWKRRALFAIVAATLLIAIGAVPSSGATKQFTLEVTPSSAVAGTSTDFTVKITNTTPGNSTINSFSVNVPFLLTPGCPGSPPGPPGCPRVLPQPESTNPNSATTISVSSSQVRVQNIDPLKTNQFIRLRITATPAALPTCSNGSADWSGNAYAGNSLNGDQFTNQVAPGDTRRTTTLLACVALRFVTGFAPTDGTINTDMHVQVEAVAGGSRVTAFTGPVTIEKLSGPGTLSGNGPVNAVDGVANFPNFRGDTVGDYVVRAISPGVANSSNAPFTLFATTIDCGETVSASGAGTDVDVTLVANAGCVSKNATVTATTSNDPDFQHLIQILASGTGGQVTFVVDTTWAPEEILPGEPIPYSTVIPDCAPGPSCDPTDPTNRETEVWCDGAFDPLDPTGMMGASMPAGHSWCRITQDTQIAEQVPGDNLKRVHEISLLINLDPSKGR